MTAIDTVLFDLGGVLIDWNPRYLYRKIFADEAEMERFLAEVCSPAWNEQQDAGRTIAAATAELRAAFPEHAHNIDAYYDRFEETLSGPVDGTPEVLAELHERGVALYALTNWSAETFPTARRRFAFLATFADILVSGEEGVKKPDPRIFELTARRFGLTPDRTLFIDDSARNIAAAGELGFRTHHFSSAPQLRADLQHAGLLAPAAT